MPLDLFLREHEKRNVAEWSHKTVDKSITTRLMNPLYDMIVLLIPSTVAPNTLSLTGVLCVLQGYHSITVLKDTFPRAGAVFAACMIFVYQIMDGIAGKHARRTMNSSALGELFDQACDNVAMPFIIVTICRSYGYDDDVSIWFIVQTVLLILLRWQFKAFIDLDRTVRYGIFGGPGKGLILIEIGLLVRAIIGLEREEQIYFKLLRYGADAVQEVMHMAGFEYYISPTNEVCDRLLWKWGPLAAFYGWLLYLLGRVIICKSTIFFKDDTTGKPTGESIPTYPTKIGLCIVLGYRALPSVMFWMPGGDGLIRENIPEVDILCDGILMSIVTCDMILAKMARRNLHYWVPIMYMMSMFDRLFTIVIVVIYFGAVFGDLCHYMNLPLLTVNVNVYCDGVYDLCHSGHKNLFKEALKFGTRLYVGVVGDVDANAYKRPPIMNMKERAAEVLGCKGVHKIIENCPCFGLTREFLREHQIHVVAHGREYTAIEQAEEYRKEAKEAAAKGNAELEKTLLSKAAMEQDKADKNPKALSERGAKYYLVPYELGITEILPRTPGMSTSDLINRCKIVSEKRNDK